MNRKKEIFTEEAKRLYGISPYSVRNYSNFKDGTTTSVYEWFTESWNFDDQWSNSKTGRREIIAEVVEVESELADRGVLATYKGLAKQNEEGDYGFTSIALVRRLFEEPSGEFEKDRDYIYFDLEGNPNLGYLLEPNTVGFTIPKDFLKEIEENKEWLGTVGFGEYNEESGAHLSYGS